jgi:DNA repair protein RadC
MKRIYELKLSRTGTSVVMDEVAPYCEVGISHKNDVAKIMRRLVAGSPREHFFAFYLNVKNRIVGYECFGIGNECSVNVHPSELLRSALVSGCRTMIVSHNHPSGSVEPSREDVDLTKCLADGCKLVGLQLLDHVIVTESSTYSFAEKGGLL